MSHSELEDIVEHFISKGEEVPEYFLGLAKFNLKVQGNGSGYSLFSKDEELYLFKKGEKSLFLCKSFDNPELEPEMIAYIKNHKYLKLNFSFLPSA